MNLFATVRTEGTANAEDVYITEIQSSEPLLSCVPHPSICTLQSTRIAETRWVHRCSTREQSERGRGQSCVKASKQCDNLKIENVLPRIGDDHGTSECQQLKNQTETR